MYRILIAEDEPKIAAFMDKGLRKSGFAPEVVNRGNEALDKLSGEKPDLLLLDLGLPDKDGQEVLKELRLQNESLPVIIVTARSIDTQEEEEMGDLANEIVYKPFLMKDLIQKIKSLLATA